MSNQKIVKNKDWLDGFNYEEPINDAPNKKDAVDRGQSTSNEGEQSDDDFWEWMGGYDNSTIQFKNEFEGNDMIVPDVELSCEPSRQLSEAEVAEFRAEMQREYEEYTEWQGEWATTKKGKATLTGILQGILYCDQIMELEVIMDELYKRQWNYGKVGEKIVLMLLARCPLFNGNKRSGFSCPTSFRRYYK